MEITYFRIKKLLTFDNFVNMDARSVISIIPLIDDCLVDTIEKLKFNNNKLNSLFSTRFSQFSNDLINSRTSKKNSFNNEKLT